MQLAQNLDIQNLFLVATLDHLRNAGTLTTEPIMAVIDESPVFTSERRPLVEEGVKAYIDRDYTKAIHVITPQIEQALRTLLALLGEPTNKPARNGLFQVKNLNDVLREPAIAAALGEDLRLYLLTFLADERRLAALPPPVARKRETKFSQCDRVNSCRLSTGHNGRLRPCMSFQKKVKTKSWHPTIDRRVGFLVRAAPAPRGALSRDIGSVVARDKAARRAEAASRTYPPDKLVKGFRQA
jgi:hypothetical protein